MLFDKDQPFSLFFFFDASLGWQTGNLLNFNRRSGGCSRLGHRLGRRLGHGGAIHGDWLDGEVTAAPSHRLLGQVVEAGLGHRLQTGEILEHRLDRADVKVDGSPEHPGG